MAALNNTKLKQEILAYFLLTIGSALFAIGDVMFVNPYLMAPGGTYGLSNVFNTLWPWKISLYAICMDVPLLIIGTLILGPRFGIKTIVSTALIFLFTLILESTWGYNPVLHDGAIVSQEAEGLVPIPNNGGWFQPDYFLNTVVAGLIYGVAIGLIFRSGATSGGSDIISMILHKYTKISLGTLVMIVDGIITLSTLIAFGDIRLPIYSVLIIFIVYALFSLFQSKTSKGKAISFAVIVIAVAFLFFQYDATTGQIVAVSAPIFQQFNPFYVVALTPVSLAIFGSLSAKGKEPSAPRKIAYGMVVAGLAYCLMAVASFGLPMPQTTIGADGEPVAVHVADVTPQLLIYTYLILTFAELLLSPMGISFVSKVAPPKYKGLMMGGWFVATAIGNKLVGVGGYLWGNIPLWAVWSVFIALCLISAVFMFSIMKRLEKVC